MSIIMLDINNMMSINKEFGCQKGDEIIQTVAKK
ncbi:MAG: GGDEF domain-containing protein [Candidatus Melainabacteria bacterium]|nr:MAG: GGDEF domain-containing protein [Candidatus Melainabacteria bacterium]